MNINKRNNFWWDTVFTDCFVCHGFVEPLWMLLWVVRSFFWVPWIYGTFLGIMVEWNVPASIVMSNHHGYLNPSGNHRCQGNVYYIHTVPMSLQNDQMSVNVCISSNPGILPFNRNTKGCMFVKGGSGTRALCSHYLHQAGELIDILSFSSGFTRRSIQKLKGFVDWKHWCILIPCRLLADLVLVSWPRPNH